MSYLWCALTSGSNMQERQGPEMINRDSLHYELTGRFAGLLDDLGKTHLSVRWEPGPKIVRVGACIETYTWDNRMQVIETLLRFERDHADEFAVEFDVVPLAPVQDDDCVEI